MEGTRVCRACGNVIQRKPKWSSEHYARRIYCDAECQRRGRPSITEDYIVTDSGCWEWQGHIDRNGYGKAYDAERPAGKRVDWAHRVSYRRHVGPIPEGYELDHTCENTRCINPAHLDPVTKVEHVYRTLQRLGLHVKQTAAAELRTYGLTYGEIAEVLGLAGRAHAHQVVQSAVANGLVDPDALPPVVRLTDEDRGDIRALHALGVPQTEIAAWYHVDSSQVSRICNGRRSGHDGEAA